MSFLYCISINFKKEDSFQMSYFHILITKITWWRLNLFRLDYYNYKIWGTYKNIGCTRYPRKKLGGNTFSWIPCIILCTKGIMEWWCVPILYQYAYLIIFTSKNFDLIQTCSFFLFERFIISPSCYWKPQGLSKWPVFFSFLPHSPPFPFSLCPSPVWPKF